MTAETGRHPGMVIPRGKGAVTRHGWPEDCLIQGGTAGVVFRRDGDSYRTAFFEAFPREPQTFIRGEGATVEEAEDQAWTRWQAIGLCPGHEYETRGRRNGSGVCRHCGLFTSEVFDLKEIGSVCTVCGVGTYWTLRDGKLYCKDHAPPREQDDPFRWLDEEDE